MVRIFMLLFLISCVSQKIQIGIEGIDNDDPLQVFTIRCEKGKGSHSGDGYSVLTWKKSINLINVDMFCSTKGLKHGDIYIWNGSYFEVVPTNYSEIVVCGQRVSESELDTGRFSGECN